jgi:hypothetical protein
MNTKLIRKLLRDRASVVLLEDGLPPLVITELAEESTLQAEDVQISSRWPKGRSIHEDPRPERSGDQILERLNKEILSLKAQIAEEEGSDGQG